jgi:type IV secretory pathway VirB2 component (pilin)
MNGIRIAITSFVLALMVIVVLGLVWVTGHQPPPLRMASYVVLGISGLSGAITLLAIWRHQPRRAR